jgi:hypothetical protein
MDMALMRANPIIQQCGDTSDGHFGLAEIQSLQALDFFGRAGWCNGGFCSKLGPENRYHEV